MIQWGEQACIDGKPVPLVSCRGMVTPPTNVKYALSSIWLHRKCCGCTHHLVSSTSGRGPVPCRFCVMAVPME